MTDLSLGGHVDPVTHETTGSSAEVRSDDLTTHGVIVGMTGSGKTGLGMVLIEEVLASGVPALLMDPQGDLTNIALTFPSLAAMGSNRGSTRVMPPRPSNPCPSSQPPKPHGGPRAWRAGTLDVPLDKSDIKVGDLGLVWFPMGT